MGNRRPALHPVDGVKHRSIELPQNPHLVMQLLGRVRGAVRALTGIDDGEEARLALRKQVTAEREQRSADTGSTSGWRTTPAEGTPPAQESSQSIRTVSGGLPTLGRRSR